MKRRLKEEKKLDVNGIEGGGFETNRRRAELKSVVAMAGT